MKNRVVFKSLAFVFGCAMFFSCSSTPKVEDVDADPSEVYRQARYIELQDGQIWSQDIPSRAGSSLYSANPFYAMNLMMKFDLMFDLRNHLNSEQIAELTRLLCTDIRFKDDTVYSRFIVVGNYFGPGKNLLLNINRIVLYKDLIPGQEYGIEYNFNASYNRATGTYTWAGTSLRDGIQTVNFDGGMVVPATNLNLGRFEYNPEMANYEKINIMDYFLYDELPENDALVELIWQELTSDPDSEKLDCIGANLNYALYLMKQGNLEQALDIFDNVDSDGLRDETFSSINHVISSDVPFMLDCYSAVKW